MLFCVTVAGNSADAGVELGVNDHERRGGNMAELNERQKRFAEAYLETGNASEAVRRAGYSERGANGVGSRLLL